MSEEFRRRRVVKELANKLLDPDTIGGKFAEEGSREGQNPNFNGNPDQNQEEMQGRGTKKKRENMHSSRATCSERRIEMRMAPDRSTIELYTRRPEESLS